MHEEVCAFIWRARDGNLLLVELRDDLADSSRVPQIRIPSTILRTASLRGAAGDAAIQWTRTIVRRLKGALRAHFMTGLPRFARNDDSSDHRADGAGGRYFRFAI